MTVSISLGRFFAPQTIIIGKWLEYERMHELMFLRIGSLGVQAELQCRPLAFREWDFGAETSGDSFSSRSLFIGPVHLSLSRTSKRSA